MLRDDACGRVEAELTAYFQGELDDTRRAAIEQHLEGCCHCASTLADIRSVFSLAGEVEDLVPSLRFKRNVSALVRRCTAARAADESVLSRIRFAWQYFVHRLRASRGFRWATASVAAHVVLLVAISLFVIPRIVGPRPGALPVAYHPDSASQRIPVLPDRAPVEGAPARVVVPDANPVVVDRGPFERRHPVPDLGPIAPYLPRLDHPVVQPLTSLFATALDDRAKARRLAACLRDPAAAREAVSNGLGYLARSQAPDGTWAPGTNGKEYRVGVTATVLIAFLSDGDSEAMGVPAYRKVVTKAIDRLLADQHEEGPNCGLIGPAEGHYAYNHALATIALVEALVADEHRVPRKRTLAVRSAARLAIRFIEKHQAADGAWPYGGGSEAGQTDSSVAVFMALALADARSARIPVKAATLTRFGGWLRSVTAEDGAVGYRASSDRVEGEGTRTAGMLTVEQLLSLAAPLRDRQASLVAKAIADPARTRKNALLRFYSALAFSMRGKSVLSRFVLGMVASQQPDGAWDSSNDPWAVYGGNAFLTAVNVLTITSAYRSAA